MGKKKVYSSRKINEVVLTAQDKKASLKTINIYLDAKTNNPLFVSMQTNKGTTNIKISSYSAKQNFSDTLFNFNKRKYPKVDVVDLR
jgi:outer membrane lipoprotein-sorting protein